MKIGNHYLKCLLQLANVLFFSLLVVVEAGASTLSLQPFVSKGQPLESKQLQAAGVIVSESREEWCSATLVGPQTVLTAAHCCNGYLDNVQKKYFEFGRDKKIELVAQNGFKSSRFQPGSNGKNILLNPTLNMAHDFCFYQLKTKAPIAPLSVNLDPNLIRKTTAMVVGSGYQNNTSEPPLGPWNRQWGLMSIQDVKTDGISATPKPSFIMFGDSGGSLLLPTKNACFVLAGVTSTSLSAYCWAYNAGQGYGGIFQSLGNGLMTEIGDPSTETAKCVKESDFNGALKPGEIYIRSLTAGFSNLSSPEFRKLLGDFVSQTGAGICGYNLNCPAVCR